LSTKTILVVDDDVDIRATLSDFLEDEGYAISVAANGRDALDYLRGHPATSLVLLDLMMPIMNGYQFRIEQKQDPAIAAVPVVVMTARGTVELAEIDVEHVLQKPFKLENLRDAIRRAERLATAGSPSPQNAD
jgi:CheY-like chemotaxis protein